MFIATHCSLIGCHLQVVTQVMPLQWFKDFSKFSAKSMFSFQGVLYVLLNSVPHLKLQRPTETRWLSHQNSVDALRRCLNAVYTSLQQESAERAEATPYGLCKEIENLSSLPHYCFYQTFLQYLGTFHTHFNYHSIYLSSSYLRIPKQL